MLKQVKSNNIEHKVQKINTFTTDQSNNYKLIKGLLKKPTLYVIETNLLYQTIKKSLQFLKYIITQDKDTSHFFSSI